MTTKKGIGSYPEEDPENGQNDSGETGCNPPSKSSKADLEAEQERIQRDLDKYREEMAEDAPASGSEEDRN